MIGKLIRKKQHTTKHNELDRRIEMAQMEPLPAHISIIMDGNGRWATKKALPRVVGHYEGMKTVRKITKFANKVGVKALTLYAFSTENWSRPKTEVDYLMRLPEEFLSTYLPELIEQNVQVQMIGNHGNLPEHTRSAIKKAVEQTSHNSGLILNFALNYGSRDEIVQSVQQIINKVQNGEISCEDICEELVNDHLMTSKLSDPDLLIRTSGEIRLSNFMLWQLAYTEFWFTNTLWPDFDEECLMEAIESFQSRNRKFGGLSNGATEVIKIQKFMDR
ncbi:Undecaprenyl pyrophosphate synthetase [Psychrobacillus sp. OK028]|uniref:isoprenyl transferase n=1 Tax=Psychrobacillus sp. OK028 TaxID=1884359 RepID=UPI000887D872|nr:isoprenyl transferase [Psychrobacillus sp. OK028]SDM39461.1 Undecaprenyl pyrophosphate synthetase [Psychrobacillus sp. OK028]